MNGKDVAHQIGFEGTLDSIKPARHYSLVISSALLPGMKFQIELMKIAIYFAVVAYI